MNTSLYNKFEEKVLHHCQKPGRYIGGELNSIRKNWDTAKVRWGLFFPDLYELGISNLGLSILYGILNNSPDVLAERFYMPAKDAVEIMERENIPPLSLENKMPAGAFDIIGITLPYELTVTNILKFLQLSAIKLHARERDFPVIIGGGSMAFNPLPMVNFFDAFVAGDGEDAVVPISEAFKECAGNKERFLERIAKIEGVFVPSVHDIKKDKIKRRAVPDLDKSEPGIPITPFVEATFNRLSLEVARGCTRGCRFCFAGMTTRPYRERKIDSIRQYLNTWLDRTGYDELSPASLSVSDFSCFSELFHCLYHIGMERKASVSLPSLRVGSIQSDVAKKISEFRKTGFTIAPETYPELQGALNKNVDFDSMTRDIQTAFSFGWNNIKLYFMIGLPGENTGGLYEIKRFIKDILRTAKSARPNITLSFSTFVPKPHTPLQWAAMDSLETILEKQKILKDLFYSEKKIYLKLHNPFMSRLEGIISRGDEAVGNIIEEAFKAGALFDAWDEHFNNSAWEKAWTVSAPDVSKYLKPYSTDDRLPWEFIDAGVKKEFLVAEYEKYFKGEPTPDCRYESCSNCGACDFKEIKNRFSAPPAPEPESGSQFTVSPSSFLPRFGGEGRVGGASNAGQASDSPESHSYLVIYEKTGNMRYLGNLDILRLWHRVLRVAGVPLKYSHGFNPQPVMDGGWALPLGMESRCEILKFESGKIELEKTFEKIRPFLPDGLSVVNVFESGDKAAVNMIARTAEFFCSIPADEYVFDNAAQIVIKKEGKEKIFEVKDYIREFRHEKGGFGFVIELSPGGMKALQFASFVAKKEVSPFDLTKIQVFLKEGETFGKRAGA